MTGPSPLANSSWKPRGSRISRISANRIAASTPRRSAAVTVTSVASSGRLQSSRNGTLERRVPVFGHVAAGLPHQPDGRDLGRFPAAGPEERGVGQLVANRRHGGGCRTIHGLGRLLLSRPMSPAGRSRAHVEILQRPWAAGESAGRNSGGGDWRVGVAALQLLVGADGSIRFRFKARRGETTPRRVPGCPPRAAEPARVRADLFVAEKWCRPWNMAMAMTGGTIRSWRRMGIRVRVRRGPMPSGRWNNGVGGSGGAEAARPEAGEAAADGRRATPREHGAGRAVPADARAGCIHPHRALAGPEDPGRVRLRDQCPGRGRRGGERLRLGAVRRVAPDVRGGAPAGRPAGRGGIRRDHRRRARA